MVRKSLLFAGTNPTFNSSGADYVNKKSYKNYIYINFYV